MHNTALFRGWDARVRPLDGALSEMSNMSMSEFPLLRSRPLRTTLVSSNLTNSGGLIRKTMWMPAYGDMVDCLCIPNNNIMSFVYMNGSRVVRVDSSEGSLIRGSKQMVSMGTKLIIWPDKKFVDAYEPTKIKNLEDFTDNPIPDLNFICECGNRLWGCRYAYDPENEVIINELYASALGEPAEWQQFNGISTDSWTASVGADGRWTGAISYNGYPTFFKEHSIFRIYPSATGAHKVVEYPVPGVMDLASRSLCSLNGVLYYQGVDGVYAWDGGQPVKVSAAWGSKKFAGGVAGAIGNEYHLCAAPIPSTATGYENLVYHADTGLWSKEDNSRILAFAEMGGKLFYMDGTYNRLKCCDAAAYDSGKEIFFAWSVVSPPIYYGSLAAPAKAYNYPPQHIRPGKFIIRLNGQKGTECTLSVKYDLETSFTVIKSFVTKNTDGIYVFPITPKRCVRFWWKLAGSGQVCIEEVSFVEEQGTENL